jgi:hypothetical protein
MAARPTFPAMAETSPISGASPGQWPLQLSMRTT